MEMAESKKITIQIPEDLLKNAMKFTQEGITPTIRRGLELLAASQAYEDLRKLRGKVKFSLSWEELKKDRR